MTDSYEFPWQVPFEINVNGAAYSVEQKEKGVFYIYKMTPMSLRNDTNFYGTIKRNGYVWTPTSEIKNAGDFAIEIMLYELKYFTNSTTGTISVKYNNEFQLLRYEMKAFWPEYHEISFIVYHDNPVFSKVFPRKIILLSSAESPDVDWGLIKIEVPMTPERKDFGTDGNKILESVKESLRLDMKNNFNIHFRK
jgi:hypothetical protein